MSPAQSVCLILVGLFALAGVSVQASEETAEQEGLECQVCHADQGTELLTDQGRYFQYMGNLDGFGPVMERFGSCIYCHVQEADSVDLTREGYRFRWMMEDMEGLKAWLEENHPSPTKEEANSEER